MSRMITLSVLALLIGGAAGSLTTMYFVEWNEPAAAYEETDNPKLLDVRDRLAALKEELRQQGQYRCCIKGDCSWCAIYMGHCPCENVVREEGKEKSCPECAAAWNRKQGKIPGVSPDAIDVTTFGVYGQEEGGHHHPASKPEDDAHGAH